MARLQYCFFVWLIEKEVEFVAKEIRGWKGWKGAKKEQGFNFVYFCPLRWNHKKGIGI